MKKFNEVVTYVRNGVRLNGLVAESRDVNGVEHLDIAYFDPEIGQMQLKSHGTISRAFSVPPLVEDAKNGWEETRPAWNTIPPMPFTFRPLGKAEPSSADLDAVEAEKKAAEETQLPWRDRPHEIGGTPGAEIPEGAIIGTGTSVGPASTNGEIDDLMVAKGYPSRDPDKKVAELTEYPPTSTPEE